MAEKRKAPEILVDSVYTFLVAQGHKKAAKALLEEAKLDEKKVKASAAPALDEVFSSFK